MSELAINFGKWDDAIDDIKSNILSIYEDRIDFLSGVQDQICNLPGDYGYKYPASNNIGTSKSDVENKKQDLEAFRDRLQDAYDYCKSEEDSLAERLFSDSNDFMHDNGIKPEYEKGAFEKFCEAFTTSAQKTFEAIADGVAWLWDSGIITVIGEVIVAVAAVVAFIACFPVSGVLGVLTAIGLGWGAVKAIADVVGDSVSFGYYVSGDKDTAEEWSDYDMKDFTEWGAEGLNDACGVEFFDELFGGIYVGLDTIEFVTGVTEFGNKKISNYVDGKEVASWKVRLNENTNLNSVGFDDFSKVHKDNRLMRFITGQDCTDYNDIKNLKKVGKTIAEFPDKGFAALFNLADDKHVAGKFKDFDKAVNFIGSPLSSATDFLSDHGYITDAQAGNVTDVYKTVKTGKDFVKNIWQGTASKNIFGGAFGGIGQGQVLGAGANSVYLNTIGDIAGFNALGNTTMKMAEIWN